MADLYKQDSDDFAREQTSMERCTDRTYVVSYLNQYLNRRL